MIKIKTFMKVIPFFVMGIVVLNSCEGDLDNLGSQLVDANGADGYDEAYSLIAYNIDNDDVIRADASKLDSVRIGAFTEDVFGMQKASYITQVRLNTYDPDFGTNPVIDSVVLTLKPRYETASDSITTTTNEDYIYPDGAVAAKKVVTTYPVSKYGKYKLGGEKTKFTIKVNEVSDFLGSTSDSLTSKKAVALGAELGSKVFDGTVNSVVVTKDSDATELLNKAVSFRMKLDSLFFQNKIIAKKGDQVLKDAASFIRYFKGLSISVSENDGYLFSMAPNDAAITIYYKNDVTATDGTVTRTKAETELNLGSSNVHLSSITYNRTNQSYITARNNAIKIADFNKIESGKNLVVSTNNYAKELYLQGMGGSSAGIRIPAATIIALKNKYKNEKIGIVSAKIRLYNDAATWNNKYKKPSNMLVKNRVLKGFLPDMTSLSSAGYSLLKTANLSTEDAYYDIGITASLKTIIEDDTYNPNTTDRDYIINLGSYLTDTTTGVLLGQYYNTRAYNPYRVVLKGTVDAQNVGKQIDAKSSKEAQLRLIYTKK
ncbi:DUF4270 family protein [Epilithonimonas hispanica]|uniref:DUF4270 domain-containing protein n=2 Tax=Epilithonimonas hispanica TaxID=358687 RepID=A0A3D9D4T4_9FLAO|nr:DUF4270 domain-containing protein [Epilithonimonas hispanica]